MRDTPTDTFHDLARTILDPDAAPVDARDACLSLHAALHAWLDLPAEPPEGTDWMHSTHLGDGLAVAPHSAASCLRDVARTRAFAQGVAAAIRAARARHPDRPARLLYAGTGPFAPLALLQCAAFGPEAVRFTLLDLHAVSVAALTRLIDRLGLGAWVETVAQADAIHWRPGQGGYDIAVAEVMQRGLSKEPQVAVTRSLAAHLAPDGVLLPERIETGLCLWDTTPFADAPARHSPLGPTFALTAPWAAALDPQADSIDIGPFIAPAQDGRHLMVRTRIEVFDGHALEELASGLTHPFPFAEELSPGRPYTLRYRLRPDPGLTALPLADR